jgi:hypothetical protein
MTTPSSTTIPSYHSYTRYYLLWWLACILFIIGIRIAFLTTNRSIESIQLFLLYFILITPMLVIAIFFEGDRLIRFAKKHYGITIPFYALQQRDVVFGHEPINHSKIREIKEVYDKTMGNLAAAFVAGGVLSWILLLQREVRQSIAGAG